MTYSCGNSSRPGHRQDHNVTSAWRTQSRGDRFGIITTHNHLVELSTFEIHPDTTWSVVMNHGEDLGVAGAEGAYRAPRLS
jgi:hypothetical protein